MSSMYIAQPCMCLFAAGSELAFCALNTSGGQSPRCRRGTVPIGANSSNRQKKGDLQPYVFLQVLVSRVLLKNMSSRLRLRRCTCIFRRAHTCNGCMHIAVLTTLSPPPC